MALSLACFWVPGKIMLTTYNIKAPRISQPEAMTNAGFCTQPEWDARSTRDADPDTEQRHLCCLWTSAKVSGYWHSLSKLWKCSVPSQHTVSSRRPSSQLDGVSKFQLQSQWSQLATTLPSYNPFLGFLLLLLSLHHLGWASSLLPISNASVILQDIITACLALQLTAFRCQLIRPRATILMIHFLRLHITPLQTMQTLA